MNSGYCVLDSAGRCIGVGTGNAAPQPGETIEYIDDVDTHPGYQDYLARRNAQMELLSIGQAPRNYDAKYDSARRLLEHLAENPIDYDAAQNTWIDDAEYPEIYDEYFNTYDLHGWTVEEFCAVIVERHENFLAAKRAEDSLREAQLRRRKLELLRVANGG